MEEHKERCKMIIDPAFCTSSLLLTLDLPNTPRRDITGEKRVCFRSRSTTLGVAADHDFDHLVELMDRVRSNNGAQSEN